MSEEQIMEKANEIAVQQEKIGKALLTILSNAKKDSSTRKTEQYIRKREEELAENIAEARKNHIKFLELELPQHTYITTKYFEAIEKKYREAMEYLETCQKAEEETKQTTSKVQIYQQKLLQEKENKKEIELNQIIRIRKQHVKIEYLTEIMETAATKLKEETKQNTFERIRNKIEAQWDAIRELHEDIMVYEEKFESDYFKNKTFKKTEEKFEEIMENLEEKINQGPTQKPNIALPKIELPYFSGGYEAWSTFYDIFQKVIHANTAITKTEKMQYLKTHVRGEASRLIQHLLIMEENYDTAWEILIKRYQNKRLIITKLMDQIMNLPTIHRENLKQLRHIHDTVHECLKAIENQGIEIENWGPMIERWVSQKWDPETNRIYEQTIANNHEVQSLTSVLEFLEKRCQSIESADNRSNGYQTKNLTFQKYVPSIFRQFRCICCNQQHRIYDCIKFTNMNPTERREVIRENKGCFNCLYPHDSPCASKRSCNKCDRKHHTLLHEERRSPPAMRYGNAKPSPTFSKYYNYNPRQRNFNSNSGTAIRNQPLPTSDKQICTNREAANNQVSKNSYSTNCNESIVLLATALVCTTTQNGNMEYLRVLIDSGSQAALMSEEAAQRIGYPRQKILAEISGISDDRPKVSKFKMQATIKPRFPSEFSLSVNFIILPKLTKNHPNQQLNMELSQAWDNKLLADPTFNQPGPIDAILGAEELGQIIQHGLQKVNDGIISQETKLGWILSGSMQQTYKKPIEIISMISRYEEDKKLQKFWELEEVENEKPISEENEKCEEHFEKNTKRSENGNYIVKIPFKEDPPQLGESKQRALARFHQLEKKLEKSENQELKKQYNAFMEEYLKLGHMVPTHRYNQGKYYIPHQPVIREESTTTKLRVVFDASSKTTNGRSLNETMHIGPRLQQELRDILLRWRKHPIVFCADIEKMYRQIKISKEDQQFQHIVWRFHMDQPIQEYQLTTVTYGTASAPYLAIKTLHKLAQDDLEVLTPGHFLIGRAIITPTHPATTMVTATYNSRWKLIQKIKKDMWKAWSTDYLNRLQLRYKWQTKQNNLEIGDVVIIKEKDINPSQWPLAKICDKHPDPDGTVRVVTVKKAKGKITKKSIHNIIPLIEETRDNQTQSKPSTNEARYSTLTRKNYLPTNQSTTTMISLLMILNLITTNRANVNITAIESGIYVEHLGNAMIERGIFQVEMKYGKQKLNEDMASVNQVTDQFEQLCNTIKQLHPSTMCHTLAHYVKDGQQKMKWINEGLQARQQLTRKRRGFLGDIMTSIFGVNDEVYKDIDELDKNQQELKKMANQQTKFMLSALSTFNDTEIRINQRLENFRTKLNQAIEAIDKWEKYQGQEKLEIQILGSFQVANNYISEICNYYEKILLIAFGRGSLHDLVSPVHVNKILDEAQRKIDSTVRIVRNFIIKTKATQDDIYIHIFSQFLLVGINNFTMMKITPVPARKGYNSTYWITDVPNAFLAIDYNNQLYYEMNNEEFKDAIIISANNWIYSPATVKNLETTPHCIIDQIYQRPNPTKCDIIQTTLNSTIWKQLYTPNAWLVVPSNAVTCAIICNNQRQDILIKNTSILQLSQDCILKTKHNLITPQRINTVQILGSYHTQIPMDNNTIRYKKIQQLKTLEPVLKHSDDLRNLLNDQKDISQDLQDYHWKTIHHHSLMFSISTGIILLIIMGCTLMAYNCWRNQKQRPKIINRRETSDATRVEMVQLQPL